VVTPTPLPARTPPDLPGFDPRWSRIITIPARTDARERIGVHTLDSRADSESESEPVTLTVVCVHGNPTWSYLWRNVARWAPEGVRVIAPDQVGMGFSAREDRDGPRRLAQRIDDLSEIVDGLDVRGPVVVIAHDWGGPVALGWSQKVLDQRESPYEIIGVVLTNTAVHQPEYRSSPRAIAATRLPGVLGIMTRRTQGFVRATTAISKVDANTARAFRAPYRRSIERRSIEDFVADIPLETNHPSRATLDRIAAGMDALTNIPTLLVWGMRDPVFSVRYLDDLRRRLPNAEVQQFHDAGHLVLEDRPDAISDIWSWIADVRSGAIRAGGKSVEAEGQSPDLVANLRRRSADLGAYEVAIGEPSVDGAGSFRDVTWAALDDRVGRLATGLRARGVRPGDRVAVLIPPGADLLAVVYAVWSLGASIVVIDAAHGPRSLLRSLRGARLDHVVAARRAEPIVRLLRVPGVVVWQNHLADLLEPSGVVDREPPGDAGTDAAIVFTSGATGPAKPVAYSRARIAATRDMLVSHYGFTDADVLVAAFAPWAVLGPLLGISSVIPEMDASRPGSLTAQALTEAMEHAGGTVMWMSPAALRSVLRGASVGSEARARLARAGGSLRLLLLAGAPIAAALLRDVIDVWPECEVRTPYGMTEVLPATDVLASEVLAEGSGHGVLVGTALPGVEIAIAPLDANGVPSFDLSSETGLLGEVAIRAPHAKDRYDSRAFVERFASRNRGWHRSGDIGLIDHRGRLWIEGRLGHVITTVDGPIGPVSVEQMIEAELDGMIVAAVGVGPVGAQVLAVVCAPMVGGQAKSSNGKTPLDRAHVQLADEELTQRVRDIARRSLMREITAVLWIDRMPVDIRHGAKIDRSKLAGDAARFLAGHR